MARKKKTKINFLALITSFVIVCFFVSLTDYKNYVSEFIDDLFKTKKTHSYNLKEIPEYNNEDYIVINDNEPNFTEEEINSEPFEEYSDFDYLNRCGSATAKITFESMPTEERKSIGMIKPTGWHTIKYDIVEGKYLYNRCHLIGYQLTGENANEKNLITCTRQMNIGAMLEFENQVAEYIKKTRKPVLYRSTPIFEGDNMLASGVQLEALSVDDSGEGIKFNVYIYNVQDGIVIDYLDGASQEK